MEPSDLKTNENLQEAGTSSKTPGSLLNKPVSRRDVLKMAGIGGLGLLLGGGAAGALFKGTKAFTRKESVLNAGRTNEKVHPFYGKHQSGIITPSQNFLCFASFDLTVASINEVRELFQKWTLAAANMTQGSMLGDSAANTSLNLPPADTGEAAGLIPSRTTITFGAGPSFFDSRFGLASKRPAAFPDLPKFRGDALQPQWCGGDIGVQVCADDLQVAFHAVRNLARIARGSAVLRWTQEGFQRTGAAEPANGTPRNLMGFKDGTGNPDVNDAKLMDEVVWAQAGDGAAWMAGGSYMVARRIRMRLEVWDRSTLDDQQRTFGRYRDSGAPLGGQDEFDPLDLNAKDAAGQPALPVTSHSRLAHMDGNTKLLRRAYSYSSGLDAKTGQLDAGLFFICFQRNVSKQFIAMQQILAASDKLNEYISHVGSAGFACFPGAAEGGYIGDTLF
ncbi:iron uptake transporter deferrochelatase/peroxidase subunit [Paenibacillus pinistramenti]|uniref:iron uptake transporter deferrochelatase/peroxidase subunit n=1 Tax=Paenibacillus pinistramenti TaxID=1768003 RepID=UPI0011083B64|nr:iron uptake transporter deferrochelatase/peroxidase subunit [Paenibacillus pinistramenti]